MKAKIILAALILGLLMPCVRADSIKGEAAVLNRDKTYEQNLQWEASNDKIITPSKVLRWITSLRGETAPPPGRTEFEPIVNVHDSHLRVIAAIAYKF